MAAAAILNFIYRSSLVYYCTYLHEIWGVYYVGGPTYRNAKILNKIKSKMAAAAILDFCTNSNNSAAD